MLEVDLATILQQVQEALEHDDLATAKALLQQLRPPDQAELFEELDEAEQTAILPQLDPAETADLLAELDETAAGELLVTLPVEEAIRVLEEMEPDSVADIIGELEPEQAQTLLDGLEDPDEVRPLLLHPSDSAGGLMTSSYLALRRRMTAAEAIAALRAEQDEIELPSELYVVDRYGRLIGGLGLGDLILADPAASLETIMEAELIAVEVGADQEQAAQLLARYDLISLPVVNAEGVLVGVITVDDVIDVLEEEATEDFQRLGASEPLDRPYLDTPVFAITRKRIGWLLLLFLTETLTGSVLRLFEDEIAAVVALSFFVPLLIGTGGNAGSQTTSTIIRALAVGDLAPRDYLASLWHELRTGLLLGIVMAAIAYGRALLWGTGSAVAETVALAILAIVVWANVLGAILPLLAARLKIDPTVVSGPAMSTVVDATGLFIYFTIARVLLNL